MSRPLDALELHELGGLVVLEGLSTGGRRAVAERFLAELRLRGFDIVRTEEA